MNERNNCKEHILFKYKYLTMEQILQRYQDRGINLCKSILDNMSNAESPNELDEILSCGIALLIELKHDIQFSSIVKNLELNCPQNSNVVEDINSLNEKKPFTTKSYDNLAFIFVDESQMKTKKRGRKPITSKRICDMCYVTETPEWRKGPDGKTILCNACGLRSKKRRNERMMKSKASIQLIIN